MFNILKDIKSGALESGEIPGFLLWLFSKTFWFWFVVAAAVVVAMVLHG